MISMFAIVEMNGWILNRAVKKPAMEENAVVMHMQNSSAITMRRPSGSIVRSNTFPNSAPVLAPRCMIIVDSTMLVPTMRPTDRSVPPSRIRPPTPSARNMRGEAACRMFSTLFTVSSCVFLTMGASTHSSAKMNRIAM